MPDDPRIWETINRMEDRINNNEKDIMQARERATLAAASVSAHEAVCAFRYAQLVMTQRWVLVAVTALGLIEVGKTAWPDIVKAVMTMH